MTQHTHDRPDRWEFSDALARLSDATPVPPADAARYQALLQAFDLRRTPKGMRLRALGWFGGLAAAAALLIAVGLPPAPVVGPPPTAQSPLASEFIPWPGASVLPPLESGELVRVQLPVTMLPSLGVAPPASHVTAVTADVVVGQDGLARAVRFVTD